MPTVRSSSSSAQPRSRAASSSRSSTEGSVRVWPVKRVSGRAPTICRMRCSGSSARIALPTPEAWMAPRLPARKKARSVSWLSTCEMNTTSPLSSMPRLTVSPVAAISSRIVPRPILAMRRLRRNAEPMMKAPTPTSQWPRSVSCNTKPRASSVSSRRCTVEAEISERRLSSVRVRPSSSASTASSARPRSSACTEPGASAAFRERGRPRPLRCSITAMTAPRFASATPAMTPRASGRMIEIISHFNPIADSGKVIRNWICLIKIFPYQNEKTFWNKLTRGVENRLVRPSPPVWENAPWRR